MTINKFCGGSATTKSQNCSKRADRERESISSGEISNPFPSSRNGISNYEATTVLEE